MNRRSVVLCALLLAGVMPVTGGELTVWTPIIPTAAGHNDRVGDALDVDMPWLVLGAPGDQRVYVYKLGDTGWRQTQTFHGGTGFGGTVAVDDGRMAIHAGGDRVVTYRLDGSTWREDVTLTGSDGFGDAIDIDGNHMAIGAPGVSAFSPLAPAGEVRTYQYDGGWKAKQTLSRGGIGAESAFGTSLDLAGNQLIVGAPAREVENEVFRGAAYIFEYSSAWTETARLSVDGALDEVGAFGDVVAIDGDNAIAGASPHIMTNGLYYDGHLFYFEARGTRWVEIQNEWWEGRDVAIEGDRAIVGAGTYDEVHIMHYVGGHWDTVRSLYDRDWRNSDFGDQVALQDDMVFVGAPRQDSAKGNTGAVWTFVENEGPVAVAGPDQRVVMDDPDGKLRVEVDGSESYDPDGHIAKHQWKWKQQTLNAEQAAFHLPVGTHTLKLTVWDDLGFSDSDTVEVEVVAQPKFKGSFTFEPNRRDPGTEVRFEDTSTNDLGTILTWDWDFNGDGRTDATGHAPTYKYTQSGKFEATLTVRDHLGKTAVATRTVTVTDDDPHADAGDDQIAQEFDAAGQGIVTLDGSASHDLEGGIAEHQWSINGVPIGEGPQLQWSFPEGVTDVRLTVRDSVGQSDRDTIRVLVPRGGPNGTQSFNSDPIAASSWHADGVRTLLFEDHSTDAETEIAFIGWDFDGDGEWDDERDEATFTFPSKGSYDIQHRAVDMDGSMHVETFAVQVNDAPPQASFVPNQLLRVPLGAPVVFLDASKDEDPIVAWSWDLNETKSTRQDLGHVFQNAGRHNISLTVTDVSGQQTTAHGFVEVFAVSDDILANWTQEQAMALEAEGKSSFLLPHEESDEQGDRATDERRGANQGAGVANDSPWRLSLIHI